MLKAAKYSILCGSIFVRLEDIQENFVQAVTLDKLSAVGVCIVYSSVRWNLDFLVSLSTWSCKVSQRIDCTLDQTLVARCNPVQETLHKCLVVEQWFHFFVRWCTKHDNLCYRPRNFFESLLLFLVSIYFQQRSGTFDELQKRLKAMWVNQGDF